MKTRLISGVLYASILIAGILISPISYALLMLALCGLCLYEYGKLAKMNDFLILGLIVVSISFIYVQNNFLAIIPINPIKFLKIPYAFLLITVITIALGSHTHLFKDMGRFLLGIFYITLPFLFSMSFTEDRSLILWFFIFIMLNDTFAYLTGKYFGKYKLAPNISPKKTIEGFLGGTLATIAVGFILQYNNLEYTFNWTIVALIAAVGGTVGDLIESKLKREAGVKDSAKTIPGHGGFLDRLDSFIFALPLLYVYINF